MYSKYKYISLLLSVFLVSVSFAEEDYQAIKDAVAKLLPKKSIDSISEAPVPGFYEVAIGANVVYVTTDGKYLMQGSIIDIENRKDLTEQRKAKFRKAELESFGPEKRIAFQAKEPKHHITVFTDIDCGYCRKLHQEMDGYNELGITVDYLMFPRAGVKSKSFQKAVNVWCNDNQQEALTKSKQGKSVEEKQCDNPIEEHFSLGKQIGVTGTPAIVTENGTLIPGYMPPEKLLERIKST